MGWYRVADVKVKEEPDERPAGLWSRGGLQGVAVTSGELWISIPRDALLALVADEIRNQQISEWEDKPSDEILKDVGIKP